MHMKTSRLEIFIYFLEPNGLQSEKCGANCWFGAFGSFMEFGN
jgi:hypothetical protein